MCICVILYVQYHYVDKLEMPPKATCMTSLKQYVYCSSYPMVLNINFFLFIYMLEMPHKAMTSFKLYPSVAGGNLFCSFYLKHSLKDILKFTIRNAIRFYKRDSKM
jgi:hypothetical protein